MFKLFLTAFVFISIIFCQTAAACRGASVGSFIPLIDPYIDGAFGGLLLLTSLVLNALSIICALFYRSFRVLKWTILSVFFSVILFSWRAHLAFFFC